MDGFSRRPRHTGRQTPLAHPQPIAPEIAPPTSQVSSIDEIVTEQLSEPASRDHLSLTPPPKRRHIFRWLFVGLLAVLLIGGGGAFMWYQDMLGPVNSRATDEISIEITQGETSSQISSKLKDLQLIKNPLAFEWYVRTSGATLKAGTCRLTQAQPVRDIVQKLAVGCHDFKSVTFYPGATIEKPLYVSPSATIDQTMYIKYRLQQAGFSDVDIAAALNKTYTGALFADKPAGTNLEGYIFGETYYVKPDATAEQTLETAFNQFYKIIEQDDLLSKFKQQGLNLYQGITLSSIVQKELNCEGKPTEERKQRCYGYQQTIAQIFLTRFKEGISLGSDVTFIYAADMLGVTPTVDLDSPYNTRIHTGLPPGPIAAPGELALKAVANPSSTDYLYFIAGDDGLIYFARTQAEHEANIKTHCQQLCNEL